jgi:molybdenum cofactor biosynthesis enzyme MoaA
MLVTTKCNQRCSYCIYRYTVVRETKRPDMTVDMAMKIVETFPRTLEIRLTGGEPLMLECFGELVDALAAKRRAVAFGTNGTKIAERYDEIPWRAIGTANISITDVDPQRYHEITGTNRFDALVEGLELLARNRPRTKRVFSFTMQKDNLKRAAEFVRFGREHGAHQVTLQPVLPHCVKGYDKYEDDSFWDRALTQQNPGVVEVLEEQRALVERNMGKARARGFVKWPFIIDRSVDGPGCMMARMYMQVDGAANVALCCRGKGPRAEMGNVIDDGAKVFSTGPMAKLRERIYDHSKPRLRKCELCYANYSGKH